MAITLVATVVTGQTYSAANFNTDVRDNINGIWILTTAGDMLYATSSSAAGRLAAPASIGLLTNVPGGPPAWLTGGSALQVLRKNAGNNGYEWASMAGLHAKALADYNAGDQSISSTSYQDISNATVNIVMTKTCTIVMYAYGVMAVNVAGNRAFVQAVIGGTGSGDTGAPHTSSPYYVPFAINYYRTGVSAGTITCKLQGRANAGGNAGIFERGRIIVTAFEE